MSSLNQVQLIGRLGADPETKYLPSGDPVTSISLATSERWKDKNTNEMKEATEWHRVEFFGRLAEVAGEYLRKGSLVYVGGSIRTQKWQDSAGNDRYTTKIRGSEMKMLGGKQDGEGGGERRDSNNGGQRQQQRPAQQQPAGGGGMDDDIPFAPLDDRIPF